MEETLRIYVVVAAAGLLAGCVLASRAAYAAPVLAGLILAAIEESGPRNPALDWGADWRFSVVFCVLLGLLATPWVFLGALWRRRGR